LVDCRLSAVHHVADTPALREPSVMQRRSLRMADWTPNIVGFLCNWCAYAGADLAGVSRLQYPPYMRVVRVMCSGRVDPVLVLAAFQRGVDGVAVLGCHHGDCHYQSGNYQAERRMTATRKILEKVGIDGRRLFLDWVSAAEGQLFAELVTSFTSTLTDLGPLGAAEGLSKKELKERLATARELTESVRLRWLVGKERELLEEGNVYGEKVDEQEFRELLDRTLYDEYNKIGILEMTGTGARPVRELAEELGITPKEAFGYLTYLEDQGMVTMAGHEGKSPTYVKVGAA
jgi:coenzyme F420-reducing hydrogenase delta subunit